MYDFIKYYGLDKQRLDFDIEQDAAVDLFTKVDYRSGELSSTKTSKYRNMELKMTQENTYVQGSIHKLYNINHNLGVQNFSDFSICQAEEALQMVCNHFKINPELTKVTNLEFGVNTPLWYDPAIFIDQSLILYYFKDHTINQKFKNKGDYKEFKRNDYSLKIYNKSKQYNCREYLLRVEIKITNKRVLERLGIFSISDLFDHEASWRLFQFLITQFRQLLIIDNLKLGEALRSSDMHLLKNYSNPNYWVHIEKQLNPGARYKKRKKCFKYIEDNGFDVTKKAVENLLWNKYDELTECSGSYGLIA